MRIEDYPPQEPFSAFAIPYVEEVVRRSAGCEGVDVFYGSDPYQGISLHVPPAPKGTVFAFVHGGGWTSGYREHMNFMAPGFLGAGVIFASIGYRLAPTHVFPAGLDDVAAATLWLMDNIADHGGDPARIFIGGHSAGGHYTALAAVRNDILPSDAVRGCLPVSGVFDFMPGGGMKQRPRFLGPQEAGNDRPASPIHMMGDTAPPFLIAHGSEDFPHLITQAERMETALAAKGCDVERIVLEGRDHFTASLAGGEVDGPWLGRALAWMESH